MAVYNFSALADGQAISFDVNLDDLVFDQATISAADVRFQENPWGTSVSVVSGPLAGKSITLSNVRDEQLATSNVQFANGSAIRFGDNAAAMNDDANNTLVGTAGNDLVQGFGGNDFMQGGDGADAMYGGAGNDTMSGNNGVDRVEGGSGNDQVTGGSGQDLFAFRHAGAANADSLSDFGSGWDSIVFDNSFFEGSSTQSFPGIGANGRLAAGDDRFHAAAGATGGADAEDRFVYNTTTRQLFYDADGNGAQAAQLVATLQAGGALAATDIVVEGNRAPPSGTITGTAGSDSLVGTAGNDTINGLGGNDTIDGLAGDDSLIGYDGNDSLRGGAGNDTLDGYHGSNNIPGGSENPQAGDTLDGGLGDDTYEVDATDTILSDAGGIDSVVARDTSWTLGAGLENLYLRRGDSDGGYGGIGNELDNIIDSVGFEHGGTLEGRGGNDYLLAAQRDARLIGGDGNDTLQGDGGPDTLLGGDGNDLLIAGPGRGAGEHLLDGGAGNDTLQGGMNAEHFIFSVAPGTTNADRIVAFDAAGVDLIRLDATAMPALGAAGTLGGGDGRFHAAPGANAGHDANDRIVYNQTTGQLWYDADGSGAGAAQLIATLEGAPDLQASDIAVDNGSSGSSTGTPGNDTLHGTAGNDTIDGLAGNDSIIGHEGNDLLIGGAGNDTLDAWASEQRATGFDTLEGGAGDDTYLIWDHTALQDSGGIDTLVNRMDGGYTMPDGFENLTMIAWSNDFLHAFGNALDNRITGSDAQNHIEGGGGNDTLVGGLTRDSLLGGAGNDLLVGGDGFDDLQGGDGNDTLDGWHAMFAGQEESTDTYDGGLGNDRFLVDNGGDSLTDAGGTDTVVAKNTSWTLGAGFENLVINNGEIEIEVSGIGNGLDNLLDGRSTMLLETGGDGWRVRLDGQGGNDTLLGSVQEDRLFGGDGNDRLSADWDFDQMTGGAGADTFHFGTEAASDNTDVIHDFASGTDSLAFDARQHAGLGATGRFGAGDERFFAGAAAHDATDRVIWDGTSLWYDEDGTGSIAAQQIAALQAGATVVATDIVVENGTAAPGGSTITGTPGNDSLTGTNGNDTLDGLGGVDTMNGLLGDDTYIVTAGDVLNDTGGIDTVHTPVNWTLGAAFEHVVVTGTGAVQVNGNNLGNRITGNNANNYINARAGNDTLAGGGGDDTFDMSTGGTSSPGNDVIDGGAGNDLIDFDGYARSGLVADLGAGTVTGGGDGGAGNTTFSSIERFVGGGFADRISGGAANELLHGRGGNDTLAGGAGVDTLVGGAGNDHFVFNVAPGAANADAVSDFASGADRLDLDNAVMTALGGNGNFSAGDARFWSAAGATAGHDADDRIVYNTSTGQLYYDADGSGGGGAQLIATLQTGAALAAADLTVI